MIDKFVYESLHFIMKWAGMLNAWAWRKHVKMIEKKRELLKVYKSQDGVLDWFNWENETIRKFK